MEKIVVSLSPTDHVVHKALSQLCKVKKVSQFTQLALSRFLQTEDGQQALQFLTRGKHSRDSGSEGSKTVTVGQKATKVVAPAKEAIPSATPVKVTDPEGGQEYKKISLGSLFKQPTA